MSEEPAAVPPPNTAPDLQFDRAELPPAKSCGICRKRISDDYFKIESKLACNTCHVKIVEQLHGGSGANRFIKASVYGSLAAALGAGIYYAILAATGYELALISILIGIMVGIAVKKGSDARGGWVYQMLAIFLTYSAIASAYVPLVISEFAKRHSDKPAATAATAEKSGAPTATSSPKSSSGPSHSSAINHMNPILALMILAAFLFALPIIAGFHSIIGLFIIGFGLYEAWKINKRVNVKITGPFPLQPAAKTAG